MGSKLKWKIPDLTGGNVNIETITEELGKLKAVKGILKKAEEFYKEALRARLDGQNQVASENFIAIDTKQPRVALNQEKAKAELEKIGKLKECMDEQQVATLRVETKADSHVGWKDVLRAIRDILPEEVTLDFEYEKDDEHYQG